MFLAINRVYALACRTREYINNLESFASNRFCPWLVLQLCGVVPHLDAINADSKAVGLLGVVSLFSMANSSGVDLRGSNGFLASLIAKLLALPLRDCFALNGEL